MLYRNLAEILGELARYVPPASSACVVTSSPPSHPLTVDGLTVGI